MLASKSIKADRRQDLANRILELLKQAHPSHWPDILKRTGVADQLGVAQLTLEEADEDTWEELRRISVAALKQGMQDGNAQMVRAFQAADEIRQGERELEGLTVMIVPATVPDNMHPMLLEQMERLTKLAQDG